MIPKYKVVFLEDAMEFLEKLDEKTREKVIYNIDKSTYVNDPKLFKKLQGNIWEFRIRYANNQIRLLAFWDKTDDQNTLVITTHGVVKKANKIPRKEIEKAERCRLVYLNTKT